MHTYVKINVEDSASFWHEQLENVTSNDCLVFCRDRDKLLWFFTKYIQHVTVLGGSEVCVIHGKMTETLSDIIYQLNNLLPIGYELADNLDALYDLLLNFETEPQNRYIFWQDSDWMLSSDPDTYLSIFERLVVSAFCNRNGIATMKEDGTRYIVNQRTFFIFNSITEDQLLPIVNKPYYIPSIEEENSYLKFDFNIIEIW